MTDIYNPVVEVMKRGQKFLVASHGHPDGDGIGSTIALAKGLEAIGKEAVMFNSDKVPFNLRFLPFADKMVHAIPQGARFDATFMVDCAQRDRIGGDVAKLPRDALGTVVLVDHHKGTSADCDILCIDEEAAATGEVVCRLFASAGFKITPDIANLLFTTFVVDSGSFRYSNTSAGLFRDAAMLVESGASPWKISIALDESSPPAYIKLLQLVLSTFEMNGKSAWVTLSQQMLKEAGADVDVAEEFINFPRSIAGIEVAMLFRELKKGKWKVSFRSKYDIDVQKIASKFGGGGHAHAAGCTIEGDLAGIKEKVLTAVSKCL